MLVSVIIPCYNQANYLKETVQSVLKSSYEPIELIIVNDGSTDNSLKIAEDLAAQFPEVFVLSQKNSGVAVARNHGIQQARGEYILPLDGDDLISDQYIEKAVRVLQENPSVKVVYAKAVKFDSSGTKAWNLKAFSRYALARDNMIYVAALFRKKDWEACGGFSEDMTMGREDWEFWIKMLKNEGEVVQLPFVGFFYRLTPGSKRKRTGTSQKKRERIAYLNRKHADFFYRELSGPLRIQRTWSKPYNKLLKILRLLK
ncbi:glycosyltransferase family 2 protein [Algoriphagus hitonicola]|uniref:Glycosyltransferase involved in cell wall bisynthesis n=1 Tax=Algoriphagus hitonicola TaxID=435880 RepID=A0A1I2UY25_9BACT|nr:glycosyltransferase family A protein [Algoriphagus hitonicola]SFG81978.1 Glycosyltransferase involved in cell wall bisynthesis [Algoriphagus hitonicola]